MKTVFKAYKYRLYPTKEQIAFLENHFGAVRFVYNYFWTQYKDSKLPSKTTLQTKLKELKKQKEYEWLKSINSQSLQVAIHNLIKAYKRAFSGEIVAQRKIAIAKAKTPKQKAKALQYGFPKFKSKKDSYQSFNIPQNVKIIDGLIYIPKLKSGLKVKFHRPLPKEAKIKQATISRNNGKYFISILVEEQIKTPTKKFAPIGIDMGLEHFAIFSDGKKISNPRWLIQSEIRLKLLQRRLSRKRLYSKNWWKLRFKIAKLHEKIKNQREDFLHKASVAIAKQYSFVAIENLSVQTMQKNHYLAKSISDASWSKFVEFLEYKCDWYGAKLIKIDRFYPTSKTCNVCGYKLDNLPLSKREWICPSCGALHDRDINASKNILKTALSGQGLPVEPVGCAKRQPLKQEAPSIIYDLAGVVH